jgi:tetratricopeptide (TPR) repeat protein/tRNA A-37 threonylcarbamoyl transferase component Bud32/TolB-like protein
MIDQTLSHFRVVRKIGEGGMGVVYEAEDVELQRRVALKVLRPDSLAREESRLRFVREARVAAKISHPHIGTVFEVGEADGGTFIAMEYVEGRTLRQVIGGRPMPIAEALRTAAQVAEGLAAAHEARVIHRDLKPENVMVGPDGRARILDFGLAKPLEEKSAKDADATVALSEDGRIVGTVAYMAPEQARGLAVDARSDHFAFGVMLYEMVTGKSAFQGETPSDTLAHILRDQPPPSFEINPEVPPELERIIEKCLEKDPADRYQDTRDLAVDLRRLIRDSEGGTQSGSGLRSAAPASSARTAGRKRVPVAAAVAIAAVALIAAAALVRPWGRGGGPRAGSPLEHSLAVMPFQNLKDADDGERLGQILQELVIADLSGDTDLKVFSSQRLYDVQKNLGSSGRHFDRETATRIAQEVGAQTVLEGSLSRLGERWILTAALIDVKTGTVEGSGRVDGSDLYQMVDDLSGELRGNAVLASADAARPVREKTSASLEAYRLYLAGTDLLNEQAYAAAADTLALAVAADPDFGKAYSNLALAKWWAANGSEAGNSEARESLRPVLERGLYVTRQERLMAEALDALIAREWGEARALYEQVTQLHPEDKQAWYGLGESQFHGEATPDDVTLASFEKAVELDPFFTLAYKHIFDCNARLGRTADSMARVRVFQVASPDKDIGFRWQVEVAHGIGGEEAMRDALDRALPRIRDPAERAHALVMSARASLDRGDVVHAQDLLQRARAIDPEGKDFQRDLTEARVLGELGRFREVLAAMDRMRANWPEETEKMGKMRADLMLLTEGPDAARRYLDDLDAAGDYEAEAGNLKLVSRVVGDEARFRRELDKQLAEAKGDETRADLWAGVGWNALEAMVQVDQAQEAFRKSLGLDAESSWAQTGLGWCLLRTGKPEEAEAAFRKAHEARPGHSQPRIGIAAAELARGRPADAERTLEEALARQEFLHAVRWMSVALAEQGRWEEAEGFARRAVAMNPSPGSLTQLAWVLIDGDRGVDEGATLATRALEETRDYYQGKYQQLACVPSPEHCLGLAAVKRGQVQEGIARLEEAALERPERDRIREDLERARALL